MRKGGGGVREQGERKKCESGERVSTESVERRGVGVRKKGSERKRE